MSEPRLSELISLQGRTALITGAGAGMGRAMALRFAEAGAGLVLVDRDAEGLEATRQLTAALAGAGPIATHQLDLADTAAIEAFWQQTGDPAPDTLVNNAGVFPTQDLLKTPAAEIQRTFDINLTATMWMCRHFIGRRGRAGGVIVNVASIEAVLPFKDHMIPYSVSKAGVLALTRSLARDYARRGFRANVIVPGGVRTPGTMRLVRQAVTGARFRLVRTGVNFQSRLPLGRWGRPDEVARVALFLASDLAAYVHGAAVPVDGGFLSA